MTPLFSAGFSAARRARSNSSTDQRRHGLSQAATALALSGSLLLSGCAAVTANGTGSSTSSSASSFSAAGTTGDSTATTQTAEGVATFLTSTGQLAEATHYDADDVLWDSADETAVVLDGTSAEVTGADPDTVSLTTDGSGAATLTITGSGTYRLTGEFTGTVVVESGEEDAVQLILDAATITATTGPAVVIEQADEVTVILQEGTENSLTDAEIYSDTSDTAPHATLFSRADLTIVGEGSLEVMGTFEDGIHSKDGLVLDSSSVRVEAVDDGVVGKDYVVLADGNLEVTAGDDAVASDNDEDADRGWISILGGTLTVSAGDDAVTAENALAVQGGTITVTSAVEGLEAAHILLAGGTVDVASSDDALNAAGGFGTDSAEEAGGMPGGEMAAGDQTLSITGGTVTLNTGGDGLDSNGTALITGGTVVVNGPEMNGNGAIDAAGGLTVEGGTLVAAGSSGMAEGLSEASTQSGVQVTLSSTVPTRTTLMLADAEGTVVAGFTTATSVASVVFSSEVIVDGQQYTLYQASSAQATPGLLTGQDASALTVDGATELGDVTAGEFTAGMGGGPGGRMGQRPGA